MERENRYSTYFSWIRAALWGALANWSAEQMEMLFRLNAQQGTGALVFPRMLEDREMFAGSSNVKSQEIAAQMKSICVQTMQEHVHLQHTLEQAWTALTKAGISPVLMKGAGLAALYPEPQRRQWGDIDLFVGKDQYHPACAVMRDTFPNALKFDEELDHYKHYNLIADGVSIEVHRVSAGMQHPLDARRYDRMERDGMTMSTERLLLGRLEVTIPEPTFNALFVMLHAWEHATTQGANVRQICDLTLLLHHYASRIDRSRLYSYLRRLHMIDVWQLYMWIAVHCLGLAQDEAPMYNERVAPRAEHFITDMLDGTLVPMKSDSPTPTNRFARKWHTMRERMRNAKRIGQYSPSYARHMRMETILHGALRLFAKDRHWE